MEYHYLLLLALFAVVHCRSNMDYTNGNLLSQLQQTLEHQPVQSNLLEPQKQDVSSRFGFGFTPQQFSSNINLGGQYAGSLKRNVHNNPSSDLGSWNSYDGKRSHRIKKRLALPNVSYLEKKHQIESALLENQQLRASIRGMDQGIQNGNVAVVDKYKSRLGKGLAENERLAKALHDVKHGGDTLVVHGEVLNSQTHPIGKAIAENQRLNERLNDVANGDDSLLVQGSGKHAMKEIRRANASLKRQIVQTRKERKQAKALATKQIRRENANIKKAIIQAKRRRVQQTPVIVDHAVSISSLQQKGLVQHNHVIQPIVVDQDHPIGLALAENQQLRSQVHALDAAKTNNNGQVSFVHKYKSTIGKGLAENERLTKQLNDIVYGSDTLVVHGEVLDMRGHPIGKGLSENDRLNQMLHDIENGKDSIAVVGSRRKLMNEIRRANALLRRKIIQAKRQQRVQKANTLKEVKRDNALLRHTIARS